MTYKHKVPFEKAEMCNRLCEMKEKNPTSVICESSVKAIVTKAEGLGLTISWNDGKEATYSQLSISE